MNISVLPVGKRYGPIRASVQRYCSTFSNYQRRQKVAWIAGWRHIHVSLCLFPLSMGFQSSTRLRGEAAWFSCGAAIFCIAHCALNPGIITSWTFYEKAILGYRYLASRSWFRHYTYLWSHLLRCPLKPAISAPSEYVLRLMTANCSFLRCALVDPTVSFTLHRDGIVGDS